MKTAYYTFTTWDDSAMAAGFDGAASGPRQGVLARQPAGQARSRGDVIDLNAWRAANLDLPQAEGPEELEAAEDWACGGAGEPEPVLPAPRPRRDHRRAQFTAELLATLAVAGAAAALMLRVLMF